MDLLICHLGGERQVKLDLDLTSYGKISPRWIKDLHVKHEITDILEEHMDAYFYNPRMGKTFTKYNTKPRSHKGKDDKFDYIKIRVFYSKFQSQK